MVYGVCRTPKTYGVPDVPAKVAGQPLRTIPKSCVLRKRQ